MKLLNKMATLGLAAYAVIALGGCGKTSNGSDAGSPAATTPATSCTQQWDGSYRDQSGNLCNAQAQTSCANARYNPATGQYVNVTTNQPVNCGYDGVNSVPYNGTNGSSTWSGCQGWTQYYSAYYPGTYYIPVNMGNGQIACVNQQSLCQVFPQACYYQASYYYQQPISTCQGSNCYNQGSSCSANLNLSYFGSSFGASVGLCL